jgi:Holliday junction resolvasome RuvABC endonuclease subunit
MFVLAVDVGIRACGYVVCEINGSNVLLVNEGQIKPNPKLSMASKLGMIFDILKKEFEKSPLKKVLVETLYSNYRHPSTLGILAQVKGVVELLAYQYGIECIECSTTRARKAFLGRGSADSLRVKKMAENMTGKSFASEHTADAFSLAVAFSHQVKVDDLRMKVISSQKDIR